MHRVIYLGNASFQGDLSAIFPSWSNAPRPRRTLKFSPFPSIDLPIAIQ